MRRLEKVVVVEDSNGVNELVMIANVLIDRRDSMVAASPLSIANPSVWIEVS